MISVFALANMLSSRHPQSRHIASHCKKQAPLLWAPPGGRIFGNDPFHGIASFDMDQLVKINLHRWKESPKNSKIAKFESGLLKKNKNNPQSPQILQTLVGALNIR